MRIPKRFRLMGQTIEVKMVDHLSHEDDAVGMALLRLNEMHIQGRTDGVKRTNEQIGHTFMHELLHFVAYHSHYAPTEDLPLHQDERFCDLLGSLLHQAFESMEFK